MRPIRADVKIMASDLTLIGLFAKDAPDVPDWFIHDLRMEEPYPQTDEQRYFQWRLYYANKMVELQNKK